MFVRAPVKAILRVASGKDKSRAGYTVGFSISAMFYVERKREEYSYELLITQDSVLRKYQYSFKINVELSDKMHLFN